MYFTNCNLDNDNNKCYYRRAFEPVKFSSLTEDEKKRLIIFTVDILDPIVVVKFVDDIVDHSIGKYDEDKSILYINFILMNTPDTNLYSYELYSFIYRMLFLGAYKTQPTIPQKGKIHKSVKKKKKENSKEGIIKTSYQALLDELRLLEQYYAIIMLHNNLLLAYIEQIHHQLATNKLPNESIHDICLDETKHIEGSGRKR